MIAKCRVVCDGADLLSENETARLVRLGLCRCGLNVVTRHCPPTTPRRPNFVPRSSGISSN